MQIHQIAKTCWNGSAEFVMVKAEVLQIREGAEAFVARALINARCLWASGPQG